MSIPTAAAPTEASVAYCLLDAGGRQLAADAAERPYYAASTIKLHVLLAALQASDRGDLDLDLTVDATCTFTGADGHPFTLTGDHLDPTHPADGDPVTVRDLLVRMIDRSSNEATNHAIALLAGTCGDHEVGAAAPARGLDVVAATIADLGLRRTRVERLIGDGSALERGATNETSAADLAVTIGVLATGRHTTADRTGSTAEPTGRTAEPTGRTAGRSGPRAGRASNPVLSPGARGLAQEALHAQRIRVIAGALRAGVEVGSKSGSVDGYRHDVAAIGDPGGSHLRCLAVMTGGMEEQVADARITDLVRELLPDLAV